MSRVKARFRRYAVVFSVAVFAMAAVHIAPDTADAQRRPAVRRSSPPPKYSKFDHLTKAHRMDCSSCHKFPSKNWNKVRPEADAFPDITDYPQHNSCLKCHSQQFFRGATPAICSICHTNPSPRNNARHPFPNPREIYDVSPKGKNAESSFVVAFPHDKHVDIVSSLRRSNGNFVNASFTSRVLRSENEASCAVCHKTMSPQGESADEYLVPPPPDLGEGFWLKRGTFKSVPLGHTTCFTCHSADTGIEPAPENCGSCHKPRPAQPAADFDQTLFAAYKLENRPVWLAWKRRFGSGRFQHEHFAHNELACATCHNISTLNALDPLTKKVPVSSCAKCHATPTTDDGGILNYVVDQRKTDPTFECMKCHVVFGKMPVPASHVRAVEEAGK